MNEPATEQYIRALRIELAQLRTLALKLSRERDALHKDIASAVTMTSNLTQLVMQLNASGAAKRARHAWVLKSILTTVNMLHAKLSAASLLGHVPHDERNGDPHG